MLKVYVVESYYRVDDEAWERCSRTRHLVHEETTGEGKVYYDKASWDEVYERNRLADVWTGRSLIRRRPYIEVSRGWPNDSRRFYKGDFKEFSYMDVYTEWKTCPLEWIMKHASADQTIQYMKERGMTVCPMQ